MLSVRPRTRRLDLDLFGSAPKDEVAARDAIDYRILEGAKEGFRTMPFNTMQPLRHLGPDVLFSSG
jgi:hypothetical protein